MEPKIQLDGSCQCGRVRFSVKSNYVYPYQLCYCSICRKTQGGGGYAINLSADATTLTLDGQEHISVYHAKLKNPEDDHVHVSSGERHFCSRCGTFLWVFDNDYPELIHPFASVIDTDLPAPPTRTHIMLEFKASWVVPDISEDDLVFERYPDESIADWHSRNKLTGKVSSWLSRS
ncbi:MAG TPA: GFA family protein [Bdellovibrionales bacterium]|nr:GFA family protein [Bdellovibrionales bacterium]